MRRSVLWPYLVLVVLLAVSATVGDGFDGRAASLAVIALAATKVAVVVAEYVEVRGAARWLVALWLVWGTGTLVGVAAITW